MVGIQDGHTQGPLQVQLGESRRNPSPHGEPAYVGPVNSEAIKQSSEVIGGACNTVRGWVGRAVAAAVAARIPQDYLVMLRKILRLWKQHSEVATQTIRQRHGWARTVNLIVDPHTIDFCICHEQRLQQRGGMGREGLALTRPKTESLRPTSPLTVIFLV